jgi:hypothetical protein
VFVSRLETTRLLLTTTLALCLGACGSDPSSGNETSSDSGETAEDESSAEASGSEASSEATGESGTDEGETGTNDTDGGGECLLWEEDDCMEGLKCMPWSSAPDGIPDETRCCDIVDNPVLVGEPCTVMDYNGSCLDDCEGGAMCLVDNDDDLTGICRPFCDITMGDSACGNNESCKPWFEMIETAQEVPLCMGKCHPLEQNCSDLGYPDWTCLPEDANDPVFVCTPPAQGTPGGEYATCLLANQCQIGLACVPQQTVMGCESALVGCCTRYCDLTEPDPCTDGNECISVESSEPGLENVGVCASPL